MEASRMNQTSAQILDEGSPGDLLQAARLRAGLSIQEVCAKLKMTSAQIDSMESNRLDGLPPGGYGRAFIKGYARLLGLDPDEILKSLLAIAGNPSRLSVGPALQISPDVAAQRLADQGSNTNSLEAQDSAFVPESPTLVVHQPLQSNTYSKWVKLSLAILGFALIAYAIVPTLSDRMTREELSVSDPVQGQMETLQSAQLGEFADQSESQAQSIDAHNHSNHLAEGVLPGFAPTQTPVQSAASSPVQPTGQTPTVTAVPTPGQNSSAAATVTPKAVSKVAEVVAPTPPSVVPSTNSAAVEAQAKAAPVKNAQVLSLQFTGRAYVTVRDRDGQLLLGQMGDAGVEKRIEGHPPFRVTIGNAKVVKIKYKDQAFNFARYVKDDVARFEIQ